MKTKDKAPVQVVMPEIKLTVADLAYMTGLLPGGTRCVGANKITDKLFFLGLIEKADIPPCPKALAEFEKKMNDWRNKVRAAVKADRWEEMLDIPYEVRESRRPSSHKDFVLTSSGKELMAKGRARSVTSAKGGCL